MSCNVQSEPSWKVCSEWNGHFNSNTIQRRDTWLGEAPTCTVCVFNSTKPRFQKSPGETSNTNQTPPNARTSAKPPSEIHCDIFCLNKLTFSPVMSLSNRLLVYGENAEQQMWRSFPGRWKNKHKEDYQKLITLLTRKRNHTRANWPLRLWGWWESFIAFCLLNER